MWASALPALEVTLVKKIIKKSDTTMVPSTQAIITPCPGTVPVVPVYTCPQVQWSEDVIMLTLSPEGLGFDSACPPGFRTQLHVTTSLSTGGGPVSCMQLSEGGFLVVYTLGSCSRSSGVVKVLH